MELIFPLMVLLVGIIVLLVGLALRRRPFVLTGGGILALLALVILAVVLQELSRPTTTTVPYPGTSGTSPAP